MINAEPTPDCVEASTPSLKLSRKPLFNPYVQILFSVTLSAGAQLFMKKGADEAIDPTAAIALGFSGLHSPWVWAGIACLIGSLISWLYALRFVPLIVAFNLAGLQHVIVPLISWLYLGEKIGGIRWLGIGLVFAGVLIVAKPIIKMEEL